MAVALVLASSMRVSPLGAQEPAAEAASPNDAPARDTSPAAVERSAELFRQGRELLARGSPEEACRRFDASLALRRSPGTLLNIGYCRARAGDLLAALEAYRSALELARDQPDREKARLWSAAAQKEIETLESRVARLTVRVPQEGVAVQVDERPVNVSDDAILLNPGAYRLRASAPGKRTLDLGIELSEGQRLTLTVPALGDDASSAAPRTDGVAAPGDPVAGDSVAGGAASAPSAASSDRNLASPEMSRGFSWQWPLLVGGGALFASGAVFGVIAARRVSQPDYGTPAESDRARALALTADVLMGTGLVGVGFGIAWPWIDPDPPPGSLSSSEPTVSGLAGACGRDRCGLSLSGAF
jgi:hypothetical protein